MAIDWEKFGPQRELDEVSKGLAREIAENFLHFGRGTPAHEKKVQLGRDRRLLNELNQSGLIANISDNYYPTFPGLYHVPSGIRLRYEEALEWVLRASRELFIERGSDTLTHESLQAKVNSLASRPVSQWTVRIGMLLARDFRKYFNHIDHSADPPVTGLGVTENILDFESLERSWEEELDSRRPPTTPSTEVPVGDGHGSPAKEAAVSRNTDFSFVVDESLRAIIRRDSDELRRVSAVSATKSRLVLAGGLIEALLLDAVRVAEARGVEARGAPRDRNGTVRPLDQWDLGHLLDAAVELKIVTPAAQRLGHGVRGYRNLVHPGLEVRSDHKVATEEADIAERVLAIVIRELMDGK